MDVITRPLYAVFTYFFYLVLFTLLAAGLTVLLVVFVPIGMGIQAFLLNAMPWNLDWSLGT